MKVYLAAPFFNKEQIEREERVKKKLRELDFIVWSPKENCICKPDANKEERTKVFNKNIIEICNSDILFAITDGKDIGTIFEAGYAYHLNLIIIYYCETLGDNSFNLMLSESGDIIITSFEQLDDLQRILSNGGNDYCGYIE